MADEYIAVADVMQHQSDMDCFVSLVEKFMKFPMYKKEITDEKYHDDLFWTVNYETDLEKESKLSKRDEVPLYIPKTSNTAGKKNTIPARAVVAAPMQKNAREKRFGLMRN